MEIIGGLLLVVGFLAALVGGIWILVLAFQESLIWGLGCFFVPFVSLIFVIMNWDISKNAFFLNLGGGLLAVIGMAIGGGG